MVLEPRRWLPLWPHACTHGYAATREAAMAHLKKSREGDPMRRTRISRRPGPRPSNAGSRIERSALSFVLRLSGDLQVKVAK